MTMTQCSNDSGSPQKNRQESCQIAWQKRLFTFSLFLLGVLLTLQSAGLVGVPKWAAQKQKPLRSGGLLCKEPVWNFGLVDSIENPRLSHEFSFMNESNEIVTIQKVHSACGCMVAEGFDNDLAPGQSTTLQVGVQLPPVPQRFQKSLVVQTDSGVLPLNVVGEIAVNNSLFTVPSVLNLGTVAVGKTKEVSILLLRHDFSPINYVGYNTENEGIEYVIAPTLDTDHHAVRLYVKATGKTPQVINSHINFITSDNKCKECSVPVRVRIVEKQ